MKRSKWICGAGGGALAIALAIGLMLVQVRRSSAAAPADAAKGKAASVVMDLALTAADVDVAATRVFRGDKSGPVEEAALMPVLGLATTNRWLNAPADPVGAEKAIAQYLFVFRKPIEVGSIQFAGSVQKLKILKPGVTLSGEKINPADWLEVPVPGNQSGAAFVPLPPGTKTAGVLLADSRPDDRTIVTLLRLLKGRFYNLTPQAQPYADSEYTAYSPFGPPFTYSAERVTQGIGEWVNTGKNAKGNIPRPPVTDVDPSWYLMTWRDKQSISGLWILDNFSEIELHYFAGPDDINPRAGTEHEWRKVRKFTQQINGGRWIQFPEALETRGLRITILKTNDSAIARINGLHVYTALYDAEMPKVAAIGEQSKPPVRVPYHYDFDGLVTMVIDDAQGNRVRNLFAREALKAGDSEGAWDLKDDAGRVVPMGKFTWKTIAHPPLKLQYVTTVYPNVLVNSPENAPWHVGQHGSGGWMADHTAPRAGASAGDLVFLGSPVAESGVAFTVTDLTGKKLWGIPGFAGFTGTWDLTADENYCYAFARADLIAGEWNIDARSDLIWSVDVKTHEVKELARLVPDNKRKRELKGVTNFGDKLYLSEGAEENWFATAATTADVKIEACFPRYPVRRQPKMAMERVPDARADFQGLFRLGGLVPGFTNVETITQLETTKGKAARRHIVLAFNKPVPIGSAIFPAPEGDNLQVRLAALKPDVPLPANPGDDSLWIPFETHGGKGFDVAIAPKDLTTTAIRVSVVRGEEDPFAVGDEKAEYEVALGSDEGMSTDKRDETTGLEGTSWLAKIDGMKFVARRFENVAPKAKIVVNSGKANPDRSWTAQRTTPLSDDDPAIYAMEWDSAQKLRGLAIEEIDGKRTEIDVWTGNGSPDLTKSDGWKHLKTFVQPRRYYGWETSNGDARYIDSYVDFGEEVETRAVRLRICEQWLDLGDRNLSGPRGDTPAEKKLDPLRARVMGIAAMHYLGGESNIGTDPLAFQRVETVDKKTGKIESEVAVASPGQIAADASGGIICISDKNIVKLDLSGKGPHQMLVKGDLIDPWSLAVDHKGNIYVYDNAPDRKNVRVYDSVGKFVREIGETGGYKVGPWNPNRMQEVTALAVDKNDQLWVVSQTYWPKRVGVFSTADGAWKKDFLGNTPYGGGGCLDPGDKNRLFLNNLEFAIDWDSGKSSLKNITWLGDSGGGEVPIYIDGRCYLVTRAMPDAAQAVAVVYLYDKDHARRVAAMGQATAFEPLKSGPVQRKLAGKPMTGLMFHWSDLNSNEVVDPDEVEFYSDAGAGRPSQFDHQLGMSGGAMRWEVTKYLDSGVPVYAMRKIDNFAILSDLAVIKTDDAGGYYVQGNRSNSGVIEENGHWKWGYYTEQTSTHGYAAAKPYWPGQMVAQFAPAGHFSTTAGDLGEAFAFHTNMGSFDLMTSDGMLAGWIFNDQRLPGKRGWTMQEHDRGMDMSDVSIGQEHFSGYVTRTSDNKYYAVAGHNHVSIVEILGMDKFKRLNGSIDVTPEAIIKTQEWEQAHQKEVNYVRAPVLDIYRAKEPKKIDGNLDDWDVPSASLGTLGGPWAAFRISYDDTYLYLAWDTQYIAPLANSGEQWDRLFKTGGAVDIQIGLDPKAPTDRKAPVAGDKRLLLTMAKNTATAVLYDAVVPGTPADQTWQAVSPVGKVTFDKVTKLEHFGMIYGGAWRGWVVEAAIPLDALGFKPTAGQRLKFDWGIIETDDSGNAVMRRTYWSNKATGIIADVPSEARLVPELWGTALIHESGRRDFAEMTDPTDESIKAAPSNGKDVGDMLDDIGDELKEDMKDK